MRGGLTPPSDSHPAPSAAVVAMTLATIWLVTLATNLGKPVHIDDTAHLEIASWIAEHPWHPMQGTVYWTLRPAPIHSLNQPHLFFYSIAAMMALIGPGPLAGQLVIALFNVVGIGSFYSLCVDFVRSGWYALIATAMLFCGPAFLPGQNLMTDAPLLALWLGYFACLFRARGTRASGLLALAALAAGAACLVKYTSLALIPVMALDAWLRRDKRARLMLLIPVAMLAAWSAFNWWDYGAIHLLDRPIEGVKFAPLEAFGVFWGRAALWILTLGALAPATLALTPILVLAPRSRRYVGGALISILVLTLATRPIVWWGPAQLAGEPWLHSALRALFFVHGIFVIALVVSAWRRLPQSESFERRERIVLGAWAAGVSLFVIALSPFIAARHVLLAIPPALLIVGRVYRDALHAPSVRAWALGALAVSTALGVWLAASDRRWADVYRDAAARYGALQPGAYFLGHWGWQWYATEAGLQPYVPGQTVLRHGDRLIVPTTVDHPPIDESDRRRARLVSVDRVECGPLTCLRTTTHRLGYYSVWEGLPWTLDDEPLEIFRLYEIDRPHELDATP